jgi:hypothetical protein
LQGRSALGRSWPEAAGTLTSAKGGKRTGWKRPIADIRSIGEVTRMTLGRALSLAALIGLVVSLVANGCKVAFTDYEPESDEWMAYGVMAALPFVALSPFPLRRLVPWAIALSLTVAAWTAYLIGGIPQLAREGSIDMGLGFLVSTSPVWITLAAILGGFLFRNAR